MGSSHANTKAERDLTSKPRSGSLDNINAPTVKLEELHDDLVRILADIKNIKKDFAETKREMLKITHQKSVINALIVYVLNIASIKKERFNDLEYKVSFEYPFILLHINEHDRKELNTFKTLLVKYMDILHHAPARLVELKKEFRLVMEQLKVREVKSLDNLSNSKGNHGIETRQRAKTDVIAPTFLKKGQKFPKPSKRKYEKLQKTIELERFEFIINVIPKLREVLDEARTRNFSDSDHIFSSVHCMTKKYSLAKKKKVLDLSRDVAN